MAFDWITFLRARRIETTRLGHTQGNIGIHCPFCGDADQGFHLGISLEGKGWNCWRSRRHRGVRPHRLIQALLKCSYLDAQRIVGDDRLPMRADAELGAYMRAKLNPKEARQDRQEYIEFPDEIRPLEDCSIGIGRIFFRYLKDRGYSLEEARLASGIYHLHYALRGPYAYRIIFPVNMFDGMATWTGRSVANREPRYYSLTSHDDKKIAGYPLAVRPIADCLWNLDEIVAEPKSTLIVTEGPFDAMRLDCYGFSRNVRSTCLFGKKVSDEQMYLLEDIASMFDNRYLLLDPDASLGLLSVLDRIRVIGFEPLRLPERFEDPAAMSKAEIIAFLKG